MPSITDGLRFVAPLRIDARTVFENGILASVAPTHEFVDADGSYLDPVSGFITQAEVNVLRIEAEGARLEDEVINYCHDQDLSDGANWLEVGGTVEAAVSATTGPDGGAAYDLTDSDGASFERIRLFPVNPSDTDEYTFNVYLAKAATPTYLPLIKFAMGTKYYGISIDPSDGTTTEITSNDWAARDWQTPTAFGAESFNDAWWRVYVTALNASDAEIVHTIGPAGVAAVSPAAGIKAATGTQTFALPQLEKSPFMSSYIPTVGAAVTRAAEDLRYAADGNINAAEGTYFVAATLPFDAADISANQNIVDTRPAGGADGFVIVAAATEDKWKFFVRSSGATVADIDSTTAPARGTTHVIAVTWKVNEFKLYIDGTLEAEQLSGAAPTALHASIFEGQRNDNLQSFFGNLAHRLIYDRVLSPGEIGQVTTDIQGWM